MRARVVRSIQGLAARLGLVGCLALALGSCSYFGWGPTARIVIQPSLAGVPLGASSRAISGAGGDLQVPDVLSYDLTVSADDMDTIVKTGIIGAIAIDVPRGAARKFTLVAHTAQLRFSGTTTDDVSASSVFPVALSVSNTDLLFPINKTGYYGIVRATLGAGGSYALADSDFTQMAAFTDPAGGTIMPSISSPNFSPGDCAVDAEGFVYVADQTLDGNDASLILKIRDASGSLLADNFFVGAQPSGSAATSGITSMAIDRANGYLYFGREGEDCFYKKGLKILEGAENQRYFEEQIPLPTGSAFLALDCAPDGRIFLARDVSGTLYLEQYAANPLRAVVPTPAQVASTPPVSVKDIQYQEGSLWVLSYSSSPAFYRYDAADLAAAPGSGGTIDWTDNAIPGNIKAGFRFVRGPGTRVYVQVNDSPGSPGLVSFKQSTDLSVDWDWRYDNIGLDYL